MPKRLDLAALRQRQRGQHRIGEQLDLSAHEVGQRRRRALVGNDQRVEPGVALEQLDGEMAGGADGGGPERVFLRVLADELEEVLEVVGRHARRGAHDQRSVGEQRHRGEVLHHVVGHALVEERIDDVHRGGQQQGVAVGRRLGDGVGADRSGRAAGAVLDDEVLPHRLVELLHQDAGDAVDRSAGRERHHHGDRARGVGLGRCGRGCERGEGDGECRNASSLMGSILSSRRRVGIGAGQELRTCRAEIAAPCPRVTACSRQPRRVGTARKSAPLPTLRSCFSMSRDSFLRRPVDSGR